MDVYITGMSPARPALINGVSNADKSFFSLETLESS